MSDPVTHEIDLDEAERAVASLAVGAWPPASALDAFDFVRQVAPTLIARLRAAEARAEAAEAERDLLAAQAPSLIAERAHYKAEVDALRARVPTEDEIESLRSVAYDYFNAAPKDVAALRALVARNTPKENPDRV